MNASFLPFKVPSAALMVALAGLAVQPTALASKRFEDIDPSLSQTAVGKVKINGPLVSSVAKIKRTSKVTAVWDENGVATVTESKPDYEVLEAGVKRSSVSDVGQKISQAIARPARIAGFYFGHLDAELGVNTISPVINRRRAIKRATAIPGPTSVLNGHPSSGAKTTDSGSATRLLLLNRIFGKAANQRTNQSQAPEQLDFAKPALKTPGVAIERPSFPSAATPRSFPRFYGRRHRGR